MSTLESTIARANWPRYPAPRLPNWIQCTDGFRMSVISGEGAYCSPRNDQGPYTEVEVGYPSERPEPWSDWSEHCEDSSCPTETVYSYVPACKVRALIALHGGEATK
jgi:hypothetical protein